MNSTDTAAYIAGAVAGIAGLLAFLVLHALWIVPIWFILPVGLLVAGGLLAARAIWASSGLVFIPFGLCYLWLIAISIVLIRRAGAAENAHRVSQGLVIP